MVVLLALIWFPAVALLVDRLGRRLRRPAAWGGTTGTLVVGLGAVLLIGPGRT